MAVNILIFKKALSVNEFERFLGRLDGSVSLVRCYKFHGFRHVTVDYKGPDLALPIADVELTGIKKKTAKQKNSWLAPDLENQRFINRAPEDPWQGQERDCGRDNLNY